MTITLLVILFAIIVIILLTTKYGIHPFFVLLCACFIVGIGIGLPVSEIITVSKDGFGNILKSLGFIIVFGTTLGVLLEHTGSTQVMATFLLRKVGERRAPFAMSLTGFIVGLPIFCDSGYIVLSGLNNALSRRTGTSAVVMAVSMATGLYAVHCLIPPHPGATAAAAIIGTDYGRLILIGTIVAIPAMLVGYAWALFAGSKENRVAHADPEQPRTISNSPSVLKAFLPIVIPIILIATKSFFTIDPNAGPTWLTKLLLLGDPVVALIIGILLALNAKATWKREETGKLLNEAVEKAGSILIIIGAGGAFGAVLIAAKLGGHLNAITGLSNLGLIAVFLVTAFLKTALGSSTVAIITAASIVQPLLPALGIVSETEKLLSVLSMGAGSMTISHANDAYFWVIAKFADLPVKTMLKVYSVATILMALTSLLVIHVFYLLLR